MRRRAPSIRTNGREVRRGPGSTAGSYASEAAERDDELSSGQNVDGVELDGAEPVHQPAQVADGPGLISHGARAEEGSSPGRRGRAAWPPELKVDQRRPREGSVDGRGSYGHLQLSPERVRLPRR